VTRELELPVSKFRKLIQDEIDVFNKALQSHFFSCHDEYIKSFSGRKSLETLLNTFNKYVDDIQRKEEEE
jgi:hypothetical protein